jgi:uncharacterized protein YceK
MNNQRRMRLMSIIELEKQAQIKAAGFIIVIALIVAACLLSGCGTVYNVTTYDKDGKIATVENVDADIIGSIVQSTKNKTLIVWHTGWAVGIHASPGTYEDPTPTLKILAGKFDDGYISICKDQVGLNWDGIAATIEATNKSLSVSPTGVAETKTVPSNFKLLEPTENP